MSDSDSAEIEEVVEEIEEEDYEIVDADDEPAAAAAAEDDEEEEEGEPEAEIEPEPVSPSKTIDSCANDVELTAASSVARDYIKYGESIVQCEVVLELGHKKKGVFGKKTVNVERVLVVGKHHVWILSRSAGKKKCQTLAEFHFFALRSLKHNAENCRLTFALRSNEPKETSLDYQYAPNSTIFTSLVESIKQITYDFPDNHLNISSTGEMPALDLPEISKYEKIVSNYIAQCSFLKCPVNKQLLDYIKHQIDADSHDLDLTSVPVITKEGADRLSCVRVDPILAALGYNTQFRYVNISGAPSAQSMRSLARYVLHNKTVTKVVARNVAPNEEGMGLFWDYLRNNGDSALQLLDLSGSAFGQQSIVSCARCLSDWPHPLPELILADCGINGKMLQTFFNALNKNPAMSISIEHLDLSGNKFDLAGTQAIDSWFNTLKSYCHVKRLVLRNTGIIFSALKSFHHITDIEEIDLSGNKMDSSSVLVLTSLLKNSTTLNKLVLDNCSLSSDSLVDIFSYMMTQSGPMSLSIANNGDISKALGKEFAACSERIVEFNISGARMKEQHFNDLMSQLIAFKGLRKLVLNQAVEKLKSPQNIADALTAIINNGLEELSLCDSVGVTCICYLLEKVPNDCSLVKLDLSDNQLGDAGVSLVCAWLRGAKRLRSLNLDNNRISLNGILDLCNVFSLNGLLSELCIENDFMRELGATTGLARKRLMHAMTRITLSLRSRDADKQEFWVSGSETPMTLPTPLQQNSLPPAPSFFAERKMSVEQPVSLPGGLTTMQIDSLEVEPAARERERKPATRTTTHRAIVASRVQKTSGAPTSPTHPPTLNAPPTLSAPPTLNAPPSLKAPPMLSVPGQGGAAASAGAEQPVSRSSSGTTPTRRTAAGPARRSAASSRRPVNTAPKANITRTSGHSSRSFEPTVELQRELEAEEAAPATSPRAEEPDPDMPALQPVAPALPTRKTSKPQRQAPKLDKPPTSASRPRALPKPQPEPAEEPAEEPEPQSPQTPSSSSRRMLIGNNRQQRSQP